MLNNFIYAQTKDLFLEALGAGNILDEAIVFIEDTKEIWNHGTYFDCSTLDPNLIPNIQTEIDELKTTVDNKADIEELNNAVGVLGPYYTVCTTSASNSAKVITISSLGDVVSGMKLNIAFASGSTSSSMTLNINGIEYPVVCKPHLSTLTAGQTLEFTFADSSWVVTGGYQYNPYTNGLKGSVTYPNSITNYGVCRTAAATSAKTVTVGGVISLVIGTQVVVKFTNGNTADSVTLNVNSTGAKAINWNDYSGAKNVCSGCIMTFVYDGTNWYVIGNSSAISSGGDSNYRIQSANNETNGLVITNTGVAEELSDAVLLIDSDGSAKNAIYSTSGDIVVNNGRVHGTIVGTPYTVTNSITIPDYADLMLYNNTGNCTVSMPANPVEGQKITFIKTKSSGTLTFSCATAILNAPKDNISNSYTVSINSIGVRTLYYINGSWYIFLTSNA